MIKCTAATTGKVAAACADRLSAIASDSLDSMPSRHHAVAALRLLLPHLPGDLSARLAVILMQLHRNPGLSEQDLWDLQSLRPLSRGRTNTGARTFSTVVLLAAAEACAQAGASGNADEALARELADAAVSLVRSQDADVALLGAQALAVAARFAGGPAVSPVLLAAHPDDHVRARAVSLWLAVGAPPGIIGRLARDESPLVRAAVAYEAGRAAGSRLPHTLVPGRRAPPAPPPALAGAGLSERRPRPRLSLRRWEIEVVQAHVRAGGS